MAESGTENIPSSAMVVSRVVVVSSDNWIDNPLVEWMNLNEPIQCNTPPSFDLSITEWGLAWYKYATFYITTQHFEVLLSINELKFIAIIMGILI